MKSVNKLIVTYHSRSHWTYCQRNRMRMKRYFTLIVATQVDAALNVYCTIQKELGW